MPDEASKEIAKPEVVRSKPFQRLQFLVRDWPNFDADWEQDAESSSINQGMNTKLENEEYEEVGGLVMVGHESAENSKVAGDGKDAVYCRLRTEMKTYMHDVIKERGLGDLQSTRDQISRCFGSVDCFLLPHPGLSVTKKNFSGSINQISSFFRGMMNR